MKLPNPKQFSELLTSGDLTLHVTSKDDADVTLAAVMYVVQ